MVGSVELGNAPNVADPATANVAVVVVAAAGND